MILIYIAAAGALLIARREEVPNALHLVFDSAFGGRAVGGGALGYTVLQSMRFGLARGAFSSQSGLGTGGIAAAAAQTREPVRQALVSMTQTFIDTIVVCTLTGLAILVTGTWTGGADGTSMARLAFEAGLPGRWGGLAVTASLALFAFSTMLGWSYYGERSLAYLGGDRVIRPYRVAFVLVGGLSALLRTDVVWLLSDVLNGLMAIPNLIGLVLLAGIVRRETRLYFERRLWEREGGERESGDGSAARRGPGGATR
jgi:AGCS family alanine or glycine:cation symporter